MATNKQSQWAINEVITPTLNPSETLLVSTSKRKSGDRDTEEIQSPSQTSPVCKNQKSHEDMNIDTGEGSQASGSPNEETTVRQVSPNRNPIQQTLRSAL